MSIALERGGGIGGSGFVRGIGCGPIYESPEMGGVQRLDPAGPKASASSSSSSSIGKDSDCCSGREESGSDGEESGEVQSKYKGPLDALEALEESLPIRRGISNFYCGKSKSFTSLAYTVASSASPKDLAKPENAYTRKRKNLLAFKSLWTKPHGHMLSSGGGISKRPAGSSRSTLALAVAMSNSRSNSNSSEEEQDHHQLLPPLHPPGKPSLAAASFGSSSPQLCSFPMRSFSLTDLQGMSGSGSFIGPKDKHSRFYYS